MVRWNKLLQNKGVRFLLFIAAVWAVWIWNIDIKYRIFDSDHYTRVAKLIEAGELKPNQFGVVYLPYSLEIASVDDKVFVTRTNGNLLVLFPRMRLRDANMIAYLYCRDEINLPKTYRDGERQIEVLVGDVIPGDQGEQVEVYVMQKLHPHWYLVHRGDD